LKINEIGEFGLIESIKKDCITSLEGVVKGIGDDCAVFHSSSGRVLLLTTDMLVEDIHFLPNTITPYHLGRKAIAVNLSDIAAMGGRPLVALISLAIPAKTEVEKIQELYRGMREICGLYSVNIVGGDTVASPDNLIINISLIGDADEQEVLYRSGARPGDKIYLTGTVGDSSAGLSILKREISPQESLCGHFIKAHNEPEPLIKTGKVIAESRLASAMIDLSDGLLSDLGHICEESRVGAVLSKDKIPLSQELKSLAAHAGFDPLDFALSGGEDYVLLVTVPAAKTQDFELAYRDSTSSPVFVIGDIREEKGIGIMNENGSVQDLAPEGFDHFSHPW
jgi:thiamine-monophosphate kinase